MRQGFSLLELAILLVIAGGLAAASTMLGSAYLAGAEVRSTRENIDTIDRAINSYVRTNKRLPCPADESVSPSSADYGKESVSGAGCTALSAGTCCTAATAASGEVKRGVLPFQTLGMTKSMAYDSWGNRISYYVDRRMTVENAVDRWPDHHPTIGDIRVEDMAGGVRTQRAVYAVVSTGAKAHGSMNRSGTMQTLSAPNDKEMENSDVDAAGASTGADRVVVQGMIGKGTDGRDFDDIVSYKLRSNLISSQVNAVKNCRAETVSWQEGIYTCTSAIGEILDGAIVTLTDTTMQDMGSVDVTCNGGVLDQSNPDCEHTPIDCPPGVVSWTVDSNCSGTVGSTILHTAATGTITNTTGGRTGTATFTCSDGTFVVNGGAICGNNCAAGTANWTGTSSCTAGYGALNHQANSTLSDAAAPGLGNTTVTCTNGGISQSGSSCTAAGCGASTLYWGAGCSAGVAGQSSGYSAGMTNGAGGYTGTATATCTEGAWGVSSPVCHARCNLPWGGSITHGSSVTAWNAWGSCGGCASQTRTCTNGSLSGSYGASSCNNGSCASCWGPSGWVGHGGWTLAYASWSVPCGGSCAAEWRYCNNGSLSGSYGASSCSVDACGPSCWNHVNDCSGDFGVPCCDSGYVCQYDGNIHQWQCSLPL